MMNQRKDTTLTMIGVRVDPAELEIFDNERIKMKSTRSESLRTIFNNHIHTLKQQQNESTDFNCTVERQ